ncbi:hypothetical protein B5U98_23995 [Bosea sp. Tri-39]|nr:hypothetical protein BLM15_08845 [Bosea sp. Tri-49]RXT18322.1 hypothetical protein B5U98_23995 [Bosea sp. Tri-39]RXT32918.1 hypothetical protein B5U99_30340 [Bosea sp. Tri-54]
MAADTGDLSGRTMLSGSGALAPLQAVALYEALSTLIDVADGLLCQPRFQHAGVLNPAGEILSLMRDELGDRAEEAIATAAKAAPTGRHHRMGWAEALIRHNARGADSVEELAAFARSLALPRS